MTLKGKWKVYRRFMIGEDPERLAEQYCVDVVEIYEAIRHICRLRRRQRGRNDANKD